MHRGAHWNLNTSMSVKQLSRLGGAWGVALAVPFVVSDVSKYITVLDQTVDGGLSQKLVSPVGTQQAHHHDESCS